LASTEEEQQMLNVPGSIRFEVTAAVLVGAFILLHSISHGESKVPRHPLRDLPYNVDAWSGVEDPLSDEIVQAVGVSDYTNRSYSADGRDPVQLYVGYYGTQKTGETMHSPKNCIPGSGWDPINSAVATIPIADGRQIVVNDYIIQRDQDKELVFYWYQGRGRVVASEYSGKFWMVADAISRHRTDGALVRLITPMNDGEAIARSRLVRFTQRLFPDLDNIIPK
jgi:EpsI family protein